MDGLCNTCRLVLYREDGELVNCMAARILPANSFHFYVQITRIVPKPFKCSQYASNLLLYRELFGLLNRDSDKKIGGVLRDHAA